MWQTLKAHGMDSANPIDRYSIFLTQQFISTYLDNAAVLWLYPHSNTWSHYSSWESSPVGPFHHRWDPASVPNTVCGLLTGLRSYQCRTTVDFQYISPSPCNNCFKNRV